MIIKLSDDYFYNVHNGDVFRYSGTYWYLNDQRLPMEHDLRGGLEHAAIRYANALMRNDIVRRRVGHPRDDARSS